MIFIAIATGILDQLAVIAKFIIATHNFLRIKVLIANQDRFLFGNHSQHPKVHTGKLFKIYFLPKQGYLYSRW